MYETTMEIEFPAEFIVYGTAVSSQASTRSRRRWKMEVKDASLSAMPEGHFWFEGPAALTLYYFPSVAMIGDVDNIIKPIQDALTGHVLKDDSQIDRVLAQRFNPETAIPFSEPSKVLTKAITSSESVLYVKISNDPYEDIP